MTHAFYEALAQEELSFEGLSVTALRAVKEPYELEATRKASAIADKAFADVLAYIEPGVTERELAARLESNMLLGGAEGKSFDTIVASGKRSAMPHGTATDKVVEKGDFITFDFGALWDGYHSDMTRTVVVGKASNEQRRFMNSFWKRSCWERKLLRPESYAAKWTVSCGNSLKTVSVHSILHMLWGTVRASKYTKNRFCRRARREYCRKI